MSDLIQKVARAVSDRELFSCGERIVVAVSGGLDSMVLLHMLASLAPEQNWRLVVAHFNHCLRGRSSNADERLVRKEADRLGLPIAVGQGNVKAFAQREKLSIEMSARQLRHEFLAHVATKQKSRKVALAHHADDQVELFFLRLLRGTGVEGLAGMDWKNPSPAGQGRGIEVVRPLLECTKDELREFTREHKIRFREDATNASFDFLRNRIRHELLPLLQKKYQPAVRKSILRLMDILGAENALIVDLLNKMQVSGEQHFAQISVALQRRWLQAQLHQMGLPGDFELVEQLRLTPGHAVSVCPDFSVLRQSDGCLTLNKHSKSFFNLRKKNVDLLGRHGIVLFGGVEIEWENLIVKPGSWPAIKAQKGKEVFDAERVGRRIVLRHWQPGDRFQPIGMPSSVKLQDLFTNLKIPQAQRMERIVAANTQGDIFWVEGLRIAEGFKVLKTSTRLLQWRWQRG